MIQHCLAVGSILAILALAVLSQESLAFVSNGWVRQPLPVSLGSRLRYLPTTSSCKSVEKPATGKVLTSMRPVRPSITSLVSLRTSSNENDDLERSGLMDETRRKVWLKGAIRLTSLVLGVGILRSLTRPAWAKSKSRTDGYAVQKDETEWKKQLSAIQYHILREGGTERPNYSVLESEDRSGVFKCAGCGTTLFSSQDKFHSGTGWPSFARDYHDSGNVEVEQVDAFQAKFGGAELRCATCGGHLGDVFQDGFLFAGTEAAKTGKRYCIDGAALIFYPEGSESPVRGDQQKKSD